jgi:hypothetical protein
MGIRDSISKNFMKNVKLVYSSLFLFSYFLCSFYSNFSDYTQIKIFSQTL